MGKFATFLIGGAVGAVAGLLLSPRSGAENRALLSEVETRSAALFPARLSCRKRLVGL